MTQLEQHGARMQNMTLRQYYAAKALQGWLASFPAEGSLPNNALSMAKELFKIADAMIAAESEVMAG